MHSNSKGAVATAPKPEDRDGLDESMVSVRARLNHVQAFAEVLLRMLILCAPRFAQRHARRTRSRDDS
jgi:hypothetical protein